MLARATRLSSADVAAIAELAYAEAREFFPAYRRLMHPDMIWGWWVEECSWRFQEFYEQFTAGRRPKVIFEAPPQHGKSSLVEDFICWVSGKNPDLKHMFASYSEDLGKKTNSVVQRQLASDTYALIFPGTRIAEFGRPSPYKRNSELVEYVGREGSFRNTTVEGQSTGKSLHLGYVDDPLKGRAEANSPTIRKNRWEWLTDEFFTRFSDDAGFILTNTRWHVDDPAGRLREKFPDCQVLRYPAIAEQDEAHRRKGEPLFPEHKSLSFLMERKQLMTQASWDSVYQQNPYVVGGGIFPIEKFIILRAVNRDLIEKSVRYWDRRARMRMMVLWPTLRVCSCTSCARTCARGSSSLTLCVASGRRAGVSPTSGRPRSSMRLPSGWAVCARLWSRSRGRAARSQLRTPRGSRWWATQRSSTGSLETRW
jgi:hypothetical protein